MQQSTETKFITDEIKRLGYEVLDLVQKRVGVTEYHNVYNKIRQQVAEIRRERKKKRVIQVRSKTCPK